MRGAFTKWRPGCSFRQSWPGHSVPSRSHGVLVDILCCTSKHARARSLNRQRTRAATSEKEVAFGVNHVGYERLPRETKKRTAIADQTPKMLPKSLRFDLPWAVKLISHPRKPSKNATTVRRYFQDDQMQVFLLKSSLLLN